MVIMYYYSWILFWSVLLSSVLISPVVSLAIPPVGEIPLLDKLRAAVAQLGSLIIDPPDDATLAPLRSTTNKYTITQNAPKPRLRAAGIETKREGFLYGPPVAGGPFFPDGPLGQARAAVDQINIQRDLGPQLQNALTDDTNAIEDVAQVCGDFLEMAQDNSLTIA